jgi:hypothetical protein
MNRIRCKQRLPNGCLYGGKVSACFSNIYLGKRHPLYVLYVAQVNRLTSQEVENYLGFLQNVLDKNLFRFRVFNFPKTPNKLYIYFKLNTKSLNRTTALMYLILFRYVEEYPSYVSYVSKIETKNPKILFESFVKAHMSLENKLPDPAGHGILCKYLHNKSQPVTFEEFQENCKREQASVYNFFVSKGIDKTTKII